MRSGFRAGILGLRSPMRVLLRLRDRGRMARQRQFENPPPRRFCQHPVKHFSIERSRVRYNKLAPEEAKWIDARCQYARVFSRSA